LKNGDKLLADFCTYVKEYDEWFSKHHKVPVEKVGPIENLLFRVFRIYQGESSKLYGKGILLRMLKTKEETRYFF